MPNLCVELHLGWVVPVQQCQLLKLWAMVLAAVAQNPSQFRPKDSTTIGSQPGALRDPDFKSVFVAPVEGQFTNTRCDDVKHWNMILTDQTQKDKRIQQVPLERALG